MYGKQKLCLAPQPSISSYVAAQEKSVTSKAGFSISELVDGELAGRDGHHVTQSRQTHFFPTTFNKLPSTAVATGVKNRQSTAELENLVKTTLISLALGFTRR